MPDPNAPKPVPVPTQRLDAGALWCKSEDALAQHQAAIIARLNGSEGTEPGGCHIMRSMTAVSVLERHGPAHTEVQSVDQVGWTDSVVRNP